MCVCLSFCTLLEKGEFVFRRNSHLPIPDDIENIAAVIDPTYDHQHGGGTSSVKAPAASPSGLATPSTLPDFLDQSSSPVPPYMPIQGTRRGNLSVDNKKKKSKDKCTHQ